MRATTRTTVAVAGMLLFGLVFSACNGAPGGSGGQPTATFGPAVQTRLAETQRPRATSTPTAESAARAATATPTPSQETPVPQPSTPDFAQPEPDPATEALLLALLSLDDMPEGWQGGEAIIENENSSGWTGDDDMFTQPGQADECGYGFDDPYLHEVSAYFEDSEQEFIVMHSVSLYANARSAESVLNQMLAAMTACPEVEEAYGDGVSKITRLTVLESQQIGDQSVRFSIGTSADEFDTALAITAVRIGQVLSFVVHIGSVQLSGPVEIWNLNELTIRSFEKIDALRETFDSLETPSKNVV